MIESSKKSKIERNEDSENKMEIRIVDEKEEVEFIQPKSQEIINIQSEKKKLFSS